MKVDRSNVIPGDHRVNFVTWIAPNSIPSIGMKLGEPSHDCRQQLKACSPILFPWQELQSTFVKSTLCTFDDVSSHMLLSLGVQSCIACMLY